MRWFVGAWLVAIVMIVSYVYLGGLEFRPSAAADPCVARAWRNPDSLEQIGEQIALSTLDGVACEIKVPREELVLALESRETLTAFGESKGLSSDELDALVRRGLERAIDDGQKAGAIGGIEAFIVRQAVARLPIDRLLDSFIDGSFTW